MVKVILFLVNILADGSYSSYITVFRGLSFLKKKENLLKWILF